MPTDEDVPTVCVCNAVDTLHDFAVRAPNVEELLAECYAQQDQALYWGPTAKVLVTYEPIRDLAWQVDFLDLGAVVNLSPAKSTGSLFADVLADERLVRALVEHAGPGRRFRLVPHTTTADLWEFAAALERDHGIRVDLPESTADQGLRDLYDTKTGLRDLALELGMATGACRVPDGVHCAGPAAAATAVGDFLDAGTPCIVKADRGEASTGLLIFRPGHDRASIADEVLASPFYGEDLIVVEEYIDGDVDFPSVEYVVPGDPEQPPYVFSVTDMLFEGETRLRGNVTSREFANEYWYEPFVEGGLRLAGAMQARGYQGHFGIDAIARDGEVFMHDLNARRTGSTHVHEFGEQVIGPDFLKTHVVGHFDFYDLPPDLTVGQVLAALGPLARSPRNANTGVVPAELTGLARGRLSCVVFAGNLAEFHAMITMTRAALRALNGEHR